MATETTLDLARELARIADSNKADDVVILDVSEQHSLIDCFVIASARSAKHIATVAEEAVARAKGLGHRGSLEVADDWVCCDFFDVVLHVFTPQARAYYDFESLWADGKRVAWTPAQESVSV